MYNAGEIEKETDIEDIGGEDGMVREEEVLREEQD